MSHLWAYVYFPNLALESYSLPGGQPQLLLAPGTKRVLQCNHQAKSLGVKSDMKLSTALCLLDQPSLVYYDQQIEQEAIERLAILAYRFSAHIQIDKTGLMLEIGSMLKLFSGPENLLQALGEVLSESGFSYQLALGHTPLTAEVLAKNNLPVVYSETPKAFIDVLDTLSTRHLGLADDLVHRLQSVGLRTFKALRTINRSELGYRFGQEVADVLTSFERAKTSLATFKLPNRFQQNIHLFHEAEQAMGLVFPLKKVFKVMEEYLVARHITADEVLVRLQHRELEPTWVSLQSVQGSNQSEHWLNLLNIRLEQTQLKAPVVGIQMKAHRFREQDQSNQDLLGNGLPKQQSEALLSSLIARLGHDRVLTVQNTGDARPEQATEYIKAGEENLSVQHSKAWPLFLNKQPYPVNPEHYQLLSLPERISAGWWQQDDFTRLDYFRAMHKRTRSIHWLSRSESGQWLLAGYFS